LSDGTQQPARSHTQAATANRSAANRAGISRRSFLRGSATTLLLCLANLTLRAPKAEAERPARARSAPAYESWADVHRARWRWDRIAKSTHYVNCAQQRGCAWDVFVKAGVVWREEQVADYPQTNAEVPDFNPRGCQKGACYSERMYDAARVLHPLKRVGERGEGRWKRLSWDEALGEVADATLDALDQHGAGSVFWDAGTGLTSGCHGLGLARTVMLLDTPLIEPNAEIGDHFPGFGVTLGKVSFASSADDLFYADLILFWGGNPNSTNIPNMHFVNEARYKGARVVCITPDYNPSAIHADEWVPVNPGSDAALGLAMAHVMLEESLFDAAFVSEQTDLPLLVRSDTGRFLRQSDREEGGEADRLYLFDRASGEIREAPRSSLALGELSPALEGEYRVQTTQGEVSVTPVFTRLRRHLAQYTPEAASRVTGTHPDQIRRLARTLARAKAASALGQTNFSKYYHGMEMERAVVLCFALAGQIGKKGAGLAALSFFSLAGPDALAASSGRLPPKLGIAALQLQEVPELIRMKWQGYSTELMLAAIGRRQYQQGLFLSTSLFLHRYGGLAERYGSARKWDPALTRDFSEHLREAQDKGWQAVPETPPRVFFEAGGNLLRRVRGYDRLIEYLLPKLDLVVTIDWRMSNTALHSDYVLPAAGWYEKDDICWGSLIAPFCHVTTRAVEPVGDSRSDWEIHCLLMKKLQERAGERGIAEFADRSGGKRRLDRIYDEFSFGGRFTEHNTEEILQELLDVATNLGGVGWEQLKAKGHARYTDVGLSILQTGHACEVEPGETITANTRQTQKKHPWPTHTRRMQFYIDHDLYFELGQVLPVHKDNPKVGGDYPLQMTGGHTRWSIHSSWRDDANLLRLQRGEPAIFLGTRDARARDIRDGDRVRVFNDLGAFEVVAKVSAGVRLGQVIVYHGWEPFQFRNRRSHQSLIPSPLNPIDLAGGYFQLDPTFLMGQPGNSDRGTRVEVERTTAM
jgi:DMSO reductase family type II enzyme molybdopterin subunit